MGSCVSRSTAAPGLGQGIATAMVVGSDGSMARFAALVTAQEALGEGRRRRDEPCFVCSSDELYFDAPVRALAEGDALQAGQLYFVLPQTMLGRPLSGQDMAALAVKASAALGAAAVADDLPPRGKNGGGAAVNKQERRRRKGRVAPLAIDGEPDAYHVDGGYETHKTAVSGDRSTVGKTRNGAGRRSSAGAARRLAMAQRLSVIVEEAASDRTIQ